MAALGIGILQTGCESRKKAEAKYEADSLKDDKVAYDTTYKSEEIAEPVLAASEKHFDAAVKYLDGKCPALHFTALDRDFDVRASLIARYQLEFRADRLLKDTRQIITGVPCAGGTALRWNACSPHIVNCFVWRVCPHV